MIGSKKVLEGGGGKKPRLVTLACDVRKITVRYHLTPERPSSKNLQTVNAGEGVEKREPSDTVGVNVNWYNHCGEQCGGSLKN